jgi:hypothetical protein
VLGEREREREGEREREREKERDISIPVDTVGATSAALLHSGLIGARADGHVISCDGLLRPTDDNI